MNCPKCGADVSDSYEPDDWSVGLVGGWYCDACDFGISESDYPREPMEGDVSIPPAAPRKGPIGTPLSQLSGRPGHPGYEEFVRIAKSWGYD
jgi:hypothetical protein